jgi:hypothetical protein
MKKLIFSAALMMTAFFSQASVAVYSLKPIPQIPQVQEIGYHTVHHTPFSAETGALPLLETTPVDDPAKDCSVTMKGTLDLGAFEAEISCTTTAATCQEATTLALSCIKAAIKTARTILL